MIEINGLLYISTPRASNKRGGGCALVADSRRFTLEKVEVAIPKNIEVAYGLLRPKLKTQKFNKIIVVSFYSTPQITK